MWQLRPSYIEVLQVDQNLARRYRSPHYIDMYRPSRVDISGMPGVGGGAELPFIFAKVKTLICL